MSWVAVVVAIREADRKVGSKVMDMLASVSVDKGGEFSTGSVIWVTIEM